MWLRRLDVQRGLKTMKNVLGCLSMAALAILLAAPVSAQTVMLRASVPFDFIVGGRTMPAGDYTISADGGSKLLLIRNASGDIAPAVDTSNIGSSRQEGKTFLMFRHYGADYFLAEVWDGSTAAGRAIPVSHAEQEKAKSATTGKPDVVMVLARR